MSTLDARLSRLEAHYLTQLSAPGLTDAERDALVERMRVTITQAWDGRTEEERQKAEQLSQTEIIRRMDELRTLLTEQTESGTGSRQSVHGGVKLWGR